ncbi:MAG: aminotransferase class I/II-fold pyridoxal phosphate-dependent enzyme [Firmicutes bacterium]|nr:aminotransferase class I/II-fold pyridoxal phosphate-dependent enzyme [Bacillota bacterium]
MKINDFKLEQFFNKYEFNSPYLLCCSDCESMSIGDLLALEPGAGENFLKSWLGYSESPGDPELLLEIAQTYKNIGAEGVLEFVGAEEAIFNFMNNALTKGDHMITMFPAYQSVYEICRSIGCAVSHWELVQDKGGWKVDVDDLARLIQANTKVIAVNSPNNPTGFVLSLAQVNAIVDLAREQGIMIFSDEVYSGLELSAKQPVSFADKYENAFALNVFSKAYGLAGLRIGWIASQNKGFLGQMLNLKYYTSICSPVPSQKLALIAIKHKEEIFAKNRRIILDNLDFSDKFFAKHRALFQYNRPAAGPIAFHKLKSDIPVAGFCDDLVQSKGVLLAPGSLFDKEGNYFRMGYGRKNFKEALDMLDEYVSSCIFL